MIARISKISLAALLSCLLTPVAPADTPFPDNWMRNAYWHDGMAEFNIYRGSVTRYGTPMPESRVLHIYVRESLLQDSLVKPDDWRNADAFPVLKLNQILHIPTGLYVYQQMHSGFWKTEGASLVKASLTSNDSCGNTYKEILRNADGSLTSHWQTYWEGMAKGSETITPPKNAIFYDELPVRVRSIDFNSLPQSFSIPMADSIIHSKHQPAAFHKADFQAKQSGNQITVQIRHAKGNDVFTLEKTFPHRILEWKRADGGHLILENSLKIDYWNYNQPGDLQRALRNPDASHKN